MLSPKQAAEWLAEKTGETPAYWVRVLSNARTPGRAQRRAVPYTKAKGRVFYEVAALEALARDIAREQRRQIVQQRVEAELELEARLEEAWLTWLPLTMPKAAASALKLEAVKQDVPLGNLVSRIAMPSILAWCAEHGHPITKAHMPPEPTE